MLILLKQIISILQSHLFDATKTFCSPDNIPDNTNFIFLSNFIMRFVYSTECIQTTN